MPPRLPRPPGLQRPHLSLVAEPEPAPQPQAQPSPGRFPARTGRRIEARSGKARARPEPTAIERALRLIAQRARTGRELDQALLRAKVPAKERATALARMRELGYIDDAATAAVRARRLVERGESPRKVQQRLRSQGVEAGAARTAAAAAAEGASDDELAARAVQQKLRGRKVKDVREKERLLRALVQKGHRPSAVARALELEWDGDDGAFAEE